MRNTIGLNTAAADDRHKGLSEFELKTSFGAVSVLDEYGTLEVYYHAFDGSRVDDVPQALAADADINQNQWA